MVRKSNDRYRTENHRRGSAFGTFLITLLLVIAIGVFAFSAWKLFGYYTAYKQGSDEYSELNDDFIKTDVQEPVADTSGDPLSTEASSDGSAGGQASGNPASGGAVTDAGTISNVTSLEDPDTLHSVLDSAYRESAVENGETKELPKLVNPVDFENLQEINPDVIGWIRVGAVNISYPVAQAEDNEYYLHRTFKKVDNFAGCIFENAYNSPYFTDQNTIIYGHNMKNGSMFGQLKKFSEQETLEKNPYFWIFTKDFIYQYRIFSSSIVNKIGDPYITRFAKEDFQQFIDKMIAGSDIDCGDVEVTTDDRIVTLSTCTGDDSTRRIVQGVLEQVYISA